MAHTTVTLYPPGTAYTESTPPTDYQHGYNKTVSAIGALRTWLQETNHVDTKAKGLTLLTNLRTQIGSVFTGTFKTHMQAYCLTEYNLLNADTIGLKAANSFIAAMIITLRCVKDAGVVISGVTVTLYENDVSITKHTPLTDWELALDVTDDTVIVFKMFIYNFVALEAELSTLAANLKTAINTSYSGDNYASHLTTICDAIVAGLAADTMDNIGAAGGIAAIVICLKAFKNCDTMVT